MTLAAAPPHSFWHLIRHIEGRGARLGAEGKDTDLVELDRLDKVQQRGKLRFGFAG